MTPHTDRFTPDQIAQVKDMAEDAMWGPLRRLAFKLSISPEVVFALCEDLEATLRENRP